MSQGQTEEQSLDSKRALFNKAKGKVAGMGEGAGGNILGGTLAGDFIKAQETLDNSIQHGAIGGNNEVAPIKGAPSKFNPFNVFRLHKFGQTITGNYLLDMHKDANRFGGESGGKVAQETKKLGANIIKYYTGGIGAIEDSMEVFDPSETQKAIQNPTAQQILEWVRQQSEDPDNQSLAPAPYQVNDFLWCKYYGKVANNRMVTLRRYPWPVEDNMKLQDKANQIPVPLAQAVTWFGEDVDNKLSSIMGIEWDMNWVPMAAKHQDIIGNEILVEDILSGLGINDETTKNAIQIAVATMQGQDLNTLELSGYDQKMYDWLQGAYGTEGPYWNRVLGPVNVVNKNIMRERGMGENLFKKDIQLVFEYSLRSYRGVNPKIAFLDLLTNFLTLTYNTAPFWGGGYRYFPKAGVKIGAAGSDLIEQGRVLEGIQVTLNSWLGSAGGATKQIMQSVMGHFQAVVEGGAKSEVDFMKETMQGGEGVTANTSSKMGTKILDNLLAGKSSALMRAPLSFRSLLEGRPIGEWHITVGNPMNPIATIGNMYVKSVSMDLSEALGADDFPTEMKFTVHLGHGKPRAKQDIESIFNSGNGALSFNALSPPSSASNTFHGKNHKPDLNDAKIKENQQGGGDDRALYQTKDTNLQDDYPGAAGDAVYTAGANLYRARVTAAYGEKYGNSTVLGDYITKTKT